MRKWVIPIAFAGIAVCAFLAGRASAMFEAQTLVLENFQASAIQRSSDAGVRVIAGTKTLQLLERGDTAEAIALNCEMTERALRPLEAIARDFPSDAERHALFARNANEVLDRLRNSGACTQPARPTL